MTRMKLLIDTDPGVDDALAIMLAHARADVVALTIAAGNVGLTHTVCNALKLVEVIGANTPVFARLRHAHSCCRRPMRRSFTATTVSATRVMRRAHAKHEARDMQLQAILRLSHEHAGELVIASIAPMTNLALALRLDPTLPQRVAKLVIMGGAVTGRGNTHLVPAEFNIGFDPEAAHVVFSTWPQFTLVDWELTMRHGIEFAMLDRWLPGTSPLSRFYDAISKKTREWTVRSAAGRA